MSWANNVPDREMIATFDGYSAGTVWELRLHPDGAVTLLDRTAHPEEMRPAAEANGVVRVFRLPYPGVLDRDALKSSLADGGEICGLLKRIRAGHVVRGDAPPRGYLTEDAQDAELALIMLLEADAFIDPTKVPMWVEEWLVGPNGSTERDMLSDIGVSPYADPDGPEVAAAAAYVRVLAEADGVVLLGSVEDHIRDLIEAAALEE